MSDMPTGCDADPYLSFVTWGRNDGYTADYLSHTSKAMRCLIGQLEDVHLNAEIVVSEWNPFPGRPLLVDALDLPKTSPHVSVVGVVADAKYHQRFKAANDFGMHNGEAWNVGIRRARGRFILPKASDTFLSSPTIARIACRDLSDDAIYRVDRYDVDMPAELWALDAVELLQSLEKLPAAHNDYIEQLSYWGLPQLHTNASGDFLLMAASLWHRLRGHPFDETALSLDGDSLIMHAARALGARQYRWESPCKVFKPRHGHLNNERITFVWRPWQQWLENVLLKLGGRPLSHRARMLLDYPRRKVRNVEKTLAPSIERQFVRPAHRWSKGVLPVSRQPNNWGLAGEPLVMRLLCRADWEKGSQRPRPCPTVSPPERRP